jgi:hypothetical protein
MNTITTDVKLYGMTLRVSAHAGRDQVGLTFIRDDQNQIIWQLMLPSDEAAAIRDTIDTAIKVAKGDLIDG